VLLGFDEGGGEVGQGGQGCVRAEKSPAAASTWWLPSQKVGREGAKVDRQTQSRNGEREAAELSPQRDVPLRRSSQVQFS
jgi:hypothetical protein